MCAGRLVRSKRRTTDARRLLASGIGEKEHMVSSRCGCPGDVETLAEAYVLNRLTEAVAKELEFHYTGCG